MELRRFYLDRDSIVGDTAFVQGEEYRHMTGVLRFRVGYQLILCDGSGKDYYATVTSIDAHQAVCHVDHVEDNQCELTYDLTLAMSCIKQDKLEFAVQKAVEVGVKNILLYQSRYTVEKDVRIDRIERIVKEACKQCGRAILPKVTLCDDIASMLDITTGDVYLAYEKANTSSLLSKVFHPSTAYTVVIGPEGGFEQSEVNAMQDKGAITFSLGARILRAETAAIVSLGDVVCLGGE